MTNIDKIFLLFNTNLKSVFERESREDQTIIDGSLFDVFLRQCTLTFAWMMFGDVCKLYENFQLFKENKAYDFEDSNLDVSHKFNSMQNMESIVTQKSYKEISAEIESIKNPATSLKTLLHSMNDTFSNYSIPA